MAPSKFANSILVSVVLIGCSSAMTLHAMTLHNASAQDASDNRSIAVPHSNLNPNFTASPSDNRSIAVPHSNLNANFTASPSDSRSIAIPHSNLNANFTASIPLASSLFEVFNSKIDVSLSDIISNPASFIGPNTIVLSGSVGTESGFLVYRIVTLDSNNDIHMILVDPGNGKVLSQRQWPAAMSTLSEILGVDPQLEGFPGVRIMPELDSSMRVP